MKKIIDIIIFSLAGLVTLAALAISIVGQNSQRSERLCRGIIVNVTDSSRIKFLGGMDIKEKVDRDFGGYVNRPVSAINLDELEKCVMEEPFIRECVAYMTNEGILNISITQCSPTVKVIRGGGLWYIDERGGCFKMENDWCAGIPVIVGNAPTDDRQWDRKVSAAFICIDGDKRFRNAVDTVSCNSKGELTLRLNSRNEDFIFGYPDDCKGKLKRMADYLDKIAGRSEKEYKSINVKYSGQIVCR